MISIRFYITSLCNGGAEKVLLNLLKQIDYSRYHVSLTTLYRGDHFDEVPKFVNKKSILKTPGFLSKVLSKIPEKLFAFLFLRGNNDCEVAYLEGRPTRIIAKKKTKGRRIAFVHCDISVKEPLKKIYKSKSECLKEYQSFNNVCFVSEDCKKGFENCVGVLNKAIVVHNVQDYSEMDRLSYEDCDSYQTTGLKILTVGRLFPPKGFERLIDIISELEKKFSFEVFIVGDGIEMKRLKEQIERLGVRSIKMLGYHKNPYPFYKKADLYICSSYFEGYSTSCVEAIHFGLPVLTTKCAGMDEILESGKFGMIVDNTTDALYNGLECFLSNKSLVGAYKENILEKKRVDYSLEEYYRLFDSEGVDK